MTTHQRTADNSHQHESHERHEHGAYVGDSHAGHGGHDHHDQHDKHAGHDPEMFRRLFWWNLLLAIPVIVFSHMIQDWFGYSIDGAWAEWVPPVIGTVVYVWGGQPFLKGAVDEVRSRQPGMMLLIALAITVAYGASLASSLGWGDLDFWWELAALIVIMLLGHWQEMKAIGQAQGALAALAELLPDRAERIEDGEPVEVAIADLAKGDVVLVRPGGRVPADGEIVDGSAAMDESMITGESRPVDRGEGDRVVAGTVSSDRAIRVRVDAVGDDTALAGIQRLVADAQSSNSRTQALADRAAAALFYVATAAAVITMLAWAAVGDAANGVIRTVTVLVIACPHALGLAIPLVISITTATSARAGILVKDRLALERMRTVDAVLFDKTGTLTKGNHAVVDRAAVEGWDSDRMMRMAAAAEADSEHPIARAIVAVGDELGDVPTATEFDAITGRGIAATVDGHHVAVGGPALLDHLDLDEPAGLADQIATWRARGGAVLYVVHDGVVVGAITVADEIRPESRAAVDALHARGAQVIMITGDASQVADAVAAELGIDEVMAEVLPKDKDAKVAELQQRGLRVAMVGDGVNDAPALARAEVGIAIGAGTDVAIESAGVVLASSDPRAVTGVIDLSRASYRKMIQNLVWATAYNVIAIPVAAGAFAFAGLTMPPAAAAVAMSLSTIIVAANAQLLRRLDLRPRELSTDQEG
ncbi:MAG: copper-translocating P-type ATPase [Ilumatobacter fluminis]|uniref:copper-translocating P-type ATPase n=1 Tax=Ilumatobacter fluminis TaxID=467091 RepID=UPI0032EC3149